MKNISLALVVTHLVWVTSAFLPKKNSSSKPISFHANGQFTGDFDKYYQQHTGRGMWKWNVALEAYQRHFGKFANIQSKMLEIGVQSGGSVLMYHQVLPQTYYYGMDVNKNCVGFNDAQSTIYLGDQASVPGWNHFFTAITPSLDMCIDDGGHQAHQMLTTIQQALPHMNQGGFFLTEDIHGQNDDYLSKFFYGAADAIALKGASVESVHVYPFVLGVQFAGQTPSWPMPAATTVVPTYEALLAALPTNLGGVVKLENAGWGATFLSADNLKNTFRTFYEMHGGVVREEPAECHDGMASTCAMIATNTNMQNLVKAVHVLKDHTLVEVNPQPPVITAIRKGTEWIPYNGPL